MQRHFTQHHRQADTFQEPNATHRVSTMQIQVVREDMADHSCPTTRAHLTQTVTTGDASDRNVGKKVRNTSATTRDERCHDQGATNAQHCRLSVIARLRGPMTTDKLTWQHFLKTPMRASGGLLAFQRRLWQDITKVVASLMRAGRRIIAMARQGIHFCIAHA